MAATLQSLFPLTSNRGNDFSVCPCYCEFSAPIVSGKYIFNKNTTPPVEFGKLLQGEKGIIAGVMITANCTDDQFTSALEPGKPLKLQLLHGSNNSPISMSPFPFTAFSHGDNFSAQWEIVGSTMLQEDPCLLSVVGEVNQITGMTSNELLLRISFIYYRVSSKKLNPVKMEGIKYLSPVEIKAL